MTTTTLDRARTAGAGLAWTILSFVLFLAAAFGVFPVTAVLRVFVETTHSLDMALWSVAWAFLAALGVLVAGRLAFGAWPRVGAGAAAVLAIGTALSVGENLALQAWATSRFGYPDPEFIGWTAGLFAVLVGLATAAFGVFVAPRGAAGWPLAFVLLGSALVVFVLASNLPGLADGLAPDSWPLAGWLGAGGLYAAAVTAACLIRARSDPAAPEQ
jgi:hypothetical protein